MNQMNLLSVPASEHSPSQEELVHNILATTSVEALLEYIETIPGIQGSKHLYPKEKLIRMIQELDAAFPKLLRQKEFGEHPTQETVAATVVFRMVTNAGGLRNQLAYLLLQKYGKQG